MPIYTYKCNNCTNQFEKRQRMSEEPLTTCPTCQGEVRRVVNSVGVVFKGSGFYVTDSRNGANGTADKTAAKPETSVPSANGAASSTAESSQKGAVAESSKKSVTSSAAVASD